MSEEQVKIDVPAWEALDSDCLRGERVMPCPGYRHDPDPCDGEVYALLIGLVDLEKEGDGSYTATDATKDGQGVTTLYCRAGCGWERSA